MILRIGYAGVCLGLPERSVSRTVRVVNATPTRLRALIVANLDDLRAILAYNVQQRFCLFRINQSIIPLASHPVNTLRWWQEDEFAPQLRALGAFIRAQGLRVSMHPGQYSVLNSENRTVVDNTLCDLTATCRILDGMELNSTHKMIIHGGAGKPDHARALTRLEANWSRLSAEVRARLVLENDDKIFSVDALLPVCQRLDVPLVFDRLHHQANPGAWSERPVAEIMADVLTTWRARDGIPKVHFSSQDPQKRPGAHAYYLLAQDFRVFREDLSTVTVDVMAECKGKDLALIRLREELGLSSLACCAVDS